MYSKNPKGIHSSLSIPQEQLNPNNNALHLYYAYIALPHYPKTARNEELIKRGKTLEPLEAIH